MMALICHGFRATFDIAEQNKAVDFGTLRLLHVQPQKLCIMEKRFIVAEMPFGTLSNAVHTKYVLFDNIKKVNYGAGNNVNISKKRFFQSLWSRSPLLDWRL